MSPSPLCNGVMFGSGALVLALAAVGSVYWPSIYFQQLQNRLVLSNESMSFDLWQETPIPMFLEIFLWNMTNSEEVVARPGLVKPVFLQMGPYVFRESHIKTNLTWHPENSTVTFHNNRTWFFEPDMSNGTLDDRVTNVNVVLATVSHMMRLQPVLLRPIVNQVMRSMHEHLFVTATALEWIFTGIEDPVIHWAIDHNIPLGIPDRFGWFYERNGSETFDGVFNMETGAADLTRLGNVARWNHAEQTPFFREHCADVKGSTGELWPPELYQDELSIFASDLCTYMTLQREGPTSRLGIDGVRYIANSSVFDNGHNYPQMACYCERPNTTDCVRSGALNVSSCRLGAPAFVSFPHFYNADPYYLTMVDGLRPNKEEHEFYMGLELFTGIPLEVRAQLQINILMRRITGMSIANSLPDDTMVPMFWFRQEVTLTEEYARQARMALTLRYGVLYGLYALAGVGVLVLVAATVLLLRRLLCERDSTPLLQRDEDGDTSPAPSAPADH